MKKEPKKFKLNLESPSQKDVLRIPMPSLDSLFFDTTAPDNDSVYTPIDWKQDTSLDHNENNSQDNTESI
jgi:hypothetical protein